MICYVFVMIVVIVMIVYLLHLFVSFVCFFFFLKKYNVFISIIVHLWINQIELKKVRTSLIGQN